MPMRLYKLNEVMYVQVLKNHMETYKWERLFSLMWPDIENRKYEVEASITCLKIPLNERNFL